jgi:hypothetical protein
MAVDEENVASCKKRDADEEKGATLSPCQWMRRVDEETGATGGRWWRRRARRRQSRRIRVPACADIGIFCPGWTRRSHCGLPFSMDFQIAIYRTRPGCATGRPASGLGRNTDRFWCSQRSPKKISKMGMPKKESPYTMATVLWGVTVLLLERQISHERLSWLLKFLFLRTIRCCNCCTQVL